MKEIEMTGKTVEEAVALALKSLNTTENDVEIEVLDVGAKGFLGFGSKPAKVLVKKKFDPVTSVKDFLKQVFLAMGVVVEIECQLKEKDLIVNLKGSNMGTLIGKRGQTLDSLQYLTSLVVNNGDLPFLNITLDTENYRNRRRETLESLAVNLAKKAKITRKNIVLEPMSSYERKIIHATLQTNRYVTTKSEGQDPHRYVVIVPKG